MKERLGVLLNGCGALDGSDVHEAVIATLEAQRAGYDVIFLANDKPQFQVCDHTTLQETSGDTRSQFIEASRLAKGKVFSLKEISPKLLSGVILPGGQGAVKNWITNFGDLDNPRSVDPDVASFLLETTDSGGSIGGISLAEFVLTTLYGSWPSGKSCIEIGPEEILINESRGVVATPGSLVTSSLPSIQTGIAALVTSLRQLCRSK